MHVYLDSSVLLRVIMGEPAALPEFRAIELAVSSELLRVECLRTIDRLRMRGMLNDAEVSRRSVGVLDAIQRVELVPITAPVLDRASQPFPTTLGTLDAIHLSSALLWQQSEGPPLTLLTHDTELATAARALGFTVIGS